jgi:hypothetical protein
MAHSRYLTIEELGELIQQGFDVQVVDSKTKEDITQAILTQIVMERDGIYLSLRLFFTKSFAIVKESSGNFSQTLCQKCWIPIWTPAMRCNDNFRVSRIPG